MGPMSQRCRHSRNDAYRRPAELRRRRRAFVCLLGGAILWAAIFAPAFGGPFVPSSDDEVVERLPFNPADPLMRELRQLRFDLARNPDDLQLALRTARRYIDLGRATGDPRYGGYAQAALGPWWQLDVPPQEVLLLRATLRQRVHQFDAALADLSSLLTRNPQNVQARLTRAAILQVQGRFEAARDECRALPNRAGDLVWAACLTGVNGVNGRLHESYRQLKATLDRNPYAQPEVRGWMLTGLAEMAARAGMKREAEAHFREALALDGSDIYLLSAFADFLLDHHRGGEVVALLKDKTRADGLLLRCAIALKLKGSSELPGQLAQLRDRFDASRRRGDRVHLREEARFTLHLLGDAKSALNLARENWAVQKEPADLRILLESALAAGDKATAVAARQWLLATGLEDTQIAHLAQAVHPN